MNNYALKLVQSSSQFARTTTDGLEISGDMTIAGWIKPASVPGAPSLDFTIAGKVDADQNANTRSYNFQYATQYPNVGTGTILWMRISDGVNQLKDGIYVNLGVGSWRHVAVVYTASKGQCEFFVDGASIGVKTGFPTSIGASPTTPFCIGATWASRSPFSTTEYMNGELDDIYVWSRALSASEIAAAHSSPCTFTPGANQAGHWAFENNYADSAGTNTLTPVNNPTFVADPAFSCTAPTPIPTPTTPPLSIPAGSTANIVLNGATIGTITFT